MEDITWGIVGSVVGALVVVIYRDLRDCYYQRIGSMTGEWDQIISAQDGEPEKKDRVECRHIKDRITGEIRRQSPSGDCRKTWGFEGRVRGDLAFLVFWTTSKGNNRSSYGTIQLHKMSDGTYAGSYQRWALSEHGDRFSGAFRTAKLEWRPR